MFVYNLMPYWHVLSGSEINWMHNFLKIGSLLNWSKGPKLNRARMLPKPNQRTGNPLNHKTWISWTHFAFQKHTIVSHVANALVKLLDFPLLQNNLNICYCGYILYFCVSKCNACNHMRCHGIICKCIYSGTLWLALVIDMYIYI